LTLSFSVEQNGLARQQSFVYVIDRRPLPRSCLARILRSEFPESTVVEAETSRRLDTAAGNNVSLIILNIEGFAMADELVLQNLANLQQALADGPLMLLTQLNESMISNAMISEVARLGARGYITESTPVAIALAAIRLVIAGGTYFPRSVIVDDSQSHAWASNASDSALTQPIAASNGLANEAGEVSRRANIAFTGRERQVLAALQRGLSNKVIAGELNLSQNTVKVHISRIMHKLHARNRTEAAVILCQDAGPRKENGFHGSAYST